MKTPPTILKLGGSIITDKRAGKPVIRTSHVKRLAREIARVRLNRNSISRTPLILLYGAGSFGHPLAHRYRLSERALSIGALTGAAKTISAMRKLGTALAEIFLEEGVPVIPLQTSSFVRGRSGKLVIANYSLIEDILSNGGIPMFGGDVIITDRRRTAIASADWLASELAQYFHSRKLFFATDVDGVYKKFPPRAYGVPLNVIRRKELRTMATSQTIRNGALDVTGAMIGKLRSLLSLRNCNVVIFNGLLRNVLAEVLCGKIHGTRIEL